MMIFLLNFFFSLISFLLFFFFLSNWERKLISKFQIRKSLNKSYFEIFHSISDFMKLILKNWLILMNLNMFTYFIFPILKLNIIMLLMLFMFPMMGNLLELKFLLFYIFIILNFLSYLIIILGWISNSNYSMIGSFRMSLQFVSFEIMMIFIFLSYLILFMSMNLLICIKYQQFFKFLFNNFFLFIIFFIILIMEINQMPFDLNESETELVSGFMIEFGNLNFLFIYMSENMLIIFTNMIMYILMIGSNMVYKIFIYYMMLMLMWIWIRSIIYRYRYDTYMFMMWKVIIFLVTFKLILNFNISKFITIL